MSKKKPNSSGIVYSTDPEFRMEEDMVQDEAVAPRAQRLRIKLDTRQRAGKAVTLVEGFVGRPGDLEELGKKLKAHCGTGGSVKDGLILVQGDQRDKILAWLVKNEFSHSKKAG